MSTRRQAVSLLVSIENTKNLDDLVNLLKAWDGQIVPVEDVIDVVDFITARSNIQGECPKPMDEPSIIRLMTWRLEGLPPECGEGLHQKYKTIDAIVEAALSVKENDDSKEGGWLNEIGMFLKDDYHLE